ncbi:MAG: hypothetical protein ACOC97_03535 [Myxococcota bacterium]
MAAALVFASACGEVDVPATLTMDPAEDNRLEIELPEEAGGGVAVVEIVGNIESTVTVDTDKLITPQGVYATVSVDDLLIAGTPVEVIGVSTGTLCTSDVPDDPGGGVAFLRPVFHKEADFELIIPTETSATNPELEALLPPLPLELELSTTTRLGLQDLADLVLEGEGLRIHEVVTTTIPEDYPILGGSDVTLDATLISTQEPTEDPLLDECEEFLAEPEQ